MTSTSSVLHQKKLIFIKAKNIRFAILIAFTNFPSHIQLVIFRTCFLPYFFAGDRHWMHKFFRQNFSRKNAEVIMLVYLLIF